MKRLRPSDENACDRIYILHNGYWDLQSKIKKCKDDIRKKDLQKE